MADRDPMIAVHRVGWSPFLARFLAPACKGGLTVGRVGDMVLRQGARAYVAKANGSQQVGALVARVERHRYGRALYVVVQRFRPLPGMIWTDFIVPAVLEAEARRIGCRMILAHVERPGMARRLEGHGFRQVWPKDDAGSILFAKEMR